MRRGDWRRRCFTRSSPSRIVRTTTTSCGSAWTAVASSARHHQPAIPVKATTEHPPPRGSGDRGRQRAGLVARPREINAPRGSLRLPQRLPAHFAPSSPRCSPPLAPPRRRLHQRIRLDSLGGPTVRAAAASTRAPRLSPPRSSRPSHRPCEQPSLSAKSPTSFASQPSNSARRRVRSTRSGTQQRASAAAAGVPPPRRRARQRRAKPPGRAALPCRLHWPPSSEWRAPGDLRPTAHARRHGTSRSTAVPAIASSASAVPDPGRQSGRHPRRPRPQRRHSSSACAGADLRLSG